MIMFIRVYEPEYKFLKNKTKFSKTYALTQHTHKRIHTLTHIHSSLHTYAICIHAQTRTHSSICS